MAGKKKMEVQGEENYLLETNLSFYDSDHDVFVVRGKELHFLSGHVSIIFGLSSRGESITTVYRGTSASIYLDNAAYRSFIYDKFGVSPVDIENASVALICAQQGVPFIVIRALSDLTGGGLAQSNEVDTFTPIAATNSVRVVVESIKKLGSH
ncbi:hypothetical protein QJS10_CPB20g00664 [Acorus calamus]|uniref:Nucleoside phosphorylase domain-containing protein n=1 Tax=Acorus calamus TaxID=4465 RepID=A0AAV9CBZ2_ACOCL|nr:hypothetical protein QJS10_CPB20g00664 [Acorus calamus]